LLSSIAHQGDVGGSALSPDRSRLAYYEGCHTATCDPDSAGTVMDIDGANAVDLDIGGFALGGPAWSPDGARLLFLTRDPEDVYHITSIGLSPGDLPVIYPTPAVSFEWAGLRQMSWQPVPASSGPAGE